MANMFKSDKGDKVAHVVIDCVSNLSRNWKIYVDGEEINYSINYGNNIINIVGDCNITIKNVNTGDVSITNISGYKDISNVARRYTCNDYDVIPYYGIHYDRLYTIALEINTNLNENPLEGYTLFHKRESSGHPNQYYMWVFDIYY